MVIVGLLAVGAVEAQEGAVEGQEDAEDLEPLPSPSPSA
jgi:hypothetical protein